MWVACLLLAFSVFLPAQQNDEFKNVKLPTSADDLAKGKKLYDGSCQLCHGPRGDGGKGANLARVKLSRAATDSDLVRLITIGIPGTEMPGAYHMSRKEVTQVAAYIRTFSQIPAENVPGDRAHGREVFLKGKCQGCHTTKNSDGLYEGGLMGPDLSAIGSRRSAAHMRQSIVEPAAETPENFRETTVTMKNGQKIVGRRVNEDTFVIIVHDYAGNNHILSKKDATDITKARNKTPMPSYADKLSASELQDLIAYLHSLTEAQ